MARKIHGDRVSQLFKEDHYFAELADIKVSEAANCGETKGNCVLATTGGSA